MPAGGLGGRRFDEFCCDGGVGEEIRTALGAPGTLVHADRCVEAADGKQRMVALTFRTMTGD